MTTDRKCWLREAISDGDGLADMAYLSIGALTLAAIAALVFIFTMSAISYYNCQPTTDIGKGDAGIITVKSCTFDPLPVGQASGTIFGAFGLLIGALAGYMAATRRAPSTRPPASEPTVTTTTTTEVAAPRAVKSAGGQKGKR